MKILTKLEIIDIAMVLLAIATLLVFVSGPGKEFYNSDESYAGTVAVNLALASIVFSLHIDSIE